MASRRLDGSESFSILENYSAFGIECGDKKGSTLMGTWLKSGADYRVWGMGTKLLSC